MIKLNLSKIIVVIFAQEIYQSSSINRHKNSQMIKLLIKHSNIFTRGGKGKKCDELCAYDYKGQENQHWTIVYS